MKRADQPLSVDPRTREESCKMYQLNRNYDVLVGNRLIVGAARPERAPRNPPQKNEGGTNNRATIILACPFNM